MFVRMLKIGLESHEMLAPRLRKTVLTNLRQDYISKVTEEFLRPSICSRFILCIPGTRTPLLSIHDSVLRCDDSMV